MILKGKKILIGVTGSIAAFKVPFLVRLLIKEGAEVKVVATDNAFDFVTPLTLSALTGFPVYNKMFDGQSGQWTSHIDLGNWADVFLIAPVSASTLGKMVIGHADNLLLATYLAARCPVFFAPAMDVDMFLHPSTQENIKLLAKRGNFVIEPRTGELASGLHGAGRMEEPEIILEILKSHFLKSGEFSGKQILITAGPTHEPIDPVRFIGNHSTGKMGFALAREAAMRGANVILVSGPVSLDIHSPAIHRIDVTTASEMAEVCRKYAAGSDVIIMSAAVADYRPVRANVSKIKKNSENFILELEPTEDIISSLSARRPEGQVIVGFSLETNNELDNASGKMISKNLDAIVLNSLNDQGAGFGHDTNKVTILQRDGQSINLPLESKQKVAEKIMDVIFGIVKQNDAENNYDNQAGISNNSD